LGNGQSQSDVVGKVDPRAYISDMARKRPPSANVMLIIIGLAILAIIAAMQLLIG
jgi:hypothetical protein